MYAIAIGASGSAIVFADRESDDVTNLPPLAPGVRARTDGALVAIARRRHPDFPDLVEVDDRAQDAKTIRITLARRGDGVTRLVYFDRGGKVLADARSDEPRHAIVTDLLNLHFSLLGGARGATWNGIGAMLLTIVAVTGIVVWWPRRLTWRYATTLVTTRGVRRAAFDLHRTMGFWTFAFVAMWSITGCALLFPQPFAHALARVAPVAPLHAAPGTHWKPGQPMRAVDDFTAAATRIAPGLVADYMSFPTRAGGDVLVRLKTPGVSIRLSRHAFVAFDPQTARTLDVYRSDERRIGDDVDWYAIQGLHFGDYGDAVGALWVVLGLSPGLLAITGIVVWFSRLRRSRTMVR